MTFRRMMVGIAGAAMAALAPLAAAQMPPALDRVPADALMVGAIKNLEQFNAEVRALAESLKLQEALTGLDQFTAILKTPGVNAGGSVAFAVLPPAGGDEEDAEPQGMVMILPVTDYQAMVKALGGAPSGGVDEVSIEDNELFVRNLEGGFIVASDNRDLVEGFAPKTGAARGFEKMLGASGKAVADKSDMFVIANVPAMAPMLKQGIEGMKQQAQFFAAMAAGGPDFEKFGAFAEDLVRDAQSAVLGIDVDKAGLSFGMAAQFTEGSQFAGYFEGGGKAGDLIAALPNQPFLFAMAADTSTTGMKALVKRLNGLTQDSGQTFGPMSVAKMIDKIDGMGFFLGTTPSIMGGLFLNTSAFLKTSDPAGYVAETKKGFDEMNKKEVQGITFITSYQPESATVGERKVDVWTLKMQPDPTNPASAQIAQVQTMLFGPTGLAGYAAKTKNGVVMTYAKNSSLLEQALQAASGGEGLNKEAGIAQIASQLPENRTLTGYVGIRNIIEIGMGFMAFMPGGGAFSFEVPEDLPPVAFGAVAGQGGIHSRVFIPTEVIDTLKNLAEQAQKAGQDEMGDEEEDEEGTGQPKF